jgi:hypothetical protein
MCLRNLRELHDQGPPQGRQERQCNSQLLHYQCGLHPGGRLLWLAPRVLRVQVAALPAVMFLSLMRYLVVLLLQVYPFFLLRHFPPLPLKFMCPAQVKYPLRKDSRRKEDRIGDWGKSWPSSLPSATSSWSAYKSQMPESSSTRKPHTSSVYPSLSCGQGSPQLYETVVRARQNGIY